MATIHTIGHKASVLGDLVHRRDLLSKNFREGEGVFVGWRKESSIGIVGDDAASIFKHAITTLDERIYYTARELVHEILHIYPGIKDQIVGGENEEQPA